MEFQDSTRSKIFEVAKRHGFERTVVLEENSKTIGVIDWIQTIKYSKLFITDSFHGLVFCIIYHIPFYAILNDVRGNDRINTLLSTVGLKNRIIDDLSAIESIDYGINWNHVDAVIDGLRKKSIEFLTSSLKVN